MNTTTHNFSTLLSVYPAHERGARSPWAGCQAFQRAQFNVPVYPHGCSMEFATTNLEEIASIFTREPTLNWYARTRATDNLVCLKFVSAEAREVCEREFGRLYATQICARPGGTEFHLFQRRKSGDPMFRLNREVLEGVGATVTSYMQLMGNKHKKSGETWEWRRGSAPGESLIAYLPPSWNASLPRRLSEVSSIFVSPRPEFDPSAARGWNDYHDLAE